MYPNFSEKEVWPATSNLASSSINLSCFTAATSYQVTLLLLPGEYIHVFKIYSYKAKSSELARIKSKCIQIFPKKKSGLQNQI